MDAQDLINSLAKDAKNIKYTKHARERLGDRDFSIRDVEKVLCNGIIIEEPREGKKGDWSYLIQYWGLERTARDVGCATIILKDNKLLVKTIEYIDL